MRRRQVRQVRREPYLSQPYSAEPSASPQRKQRQRPIGKIVLRGLLAVGLAAGLSAYRVSSVEVKDSPGADRLRAATEAQLDQKAWYRSLALMPVKKIATSVAEANQDLVAEVNLERQWFSRKLIISPKGRSANLRWQSGGDAYLVDQKGIVISRASAQDQAGLPLVIDTTGLVVQTNQPVATTAFVDFINTVYNQIGPITSLSAKTSRVGETTNEVEVETSAGFRVRFDTSRPAEEQLQAVAAILNNLKATNAAQPSQYIDVRLPYKAYYR